MSEDRKEIYINRELSWLAFNERVLEEAQDKSNPLIERLKFLAITESNMDEFFMVRVSAIWEQAESQINTKDYSGYTPYELLNAITKRVQKFSKKQHNCLNRSVLPLLSKQGFQFKRYSDLTEQQQEFADQYYEQVIYPILTPMAIDTSRPFPLLPNKSLNFIVLLSEEGENYYAVVQVPNVISRFLELPAASQREFIFIEEIIKANMENLFQGYRVEKSHLFRLTRDSDLEIDEEDTSDLLKEIENSIKKRKWGDPIRLEIDVQMDEDLRLFLEKSLDIEPICIYEISGFIDLTAWMKFSSLKGLEHLKNEVLPPLPVMEFHNKSVFEAIQEKDILVHHPYHSFSCVLNFVKEAAGDPHVLAIKQTLYRVSGDSPIVKALISAAENGKQVTVVVEVKARFDEENNIQWAKQLEKAGCHVIYGLVGLKTHCKACLVVRNEEEGIRRYVHMGTGNYNDSTAKLYTDIGFFTCSPTFGSDISALFNVLTGYSTALEWKRIAVAPITLRQMFLSWIDNEVKIAAEGRPARIIAKMNSLVDKEIIDHLYAAAEKGVRVDLIVRGICCLSTGMEKVKKNIRVISIVDRFLEHSRIYCFENGGAPKVFLSSADWMTRNLDKRVEIAFPVEQEDIKQELIAILNISLKDTVKARVLRPSGVYERIDKRGKEILHSQLFLYQKMKKVQEVIPDFESEVFQPVLPYDNDLE